MTTAILDAATVVATLRGDRSLRPLTDRHSAAGLRAQLEDGLFPLVSDVDPRAPLVIRPRSFRDEQTDTSPGIGLLRGLLVHEVLRLFVTGVPLDDPYTDGVDAWQSHNDVTELRAAFNALDENDRARLATDVRAHSATLVQRLGPVSPLWRPRTAQNIIQRLAGGRVICRDVIDVVVGSGATQHASLALIDVTTATLTTSHERLMRYHALMESLRTQVVPLRIAMLSTATGMVWRRDVDTEMLQRAVDDVLCLVDRARKTA